MKLIVPQLWSLSAAALVSSLVLALGCTTLGSAPSLVRYEAENAKIYGSSHQKADAPPGTERQSFYSGALAAGGLNKDLAASAAAPDWSNIAYVSFAVKVPAAGPYDVKIAYNGDDDKTVLVRANGGAAQTVKVPRVADGTWNLMHTKVVTLDLQSGANTVEISGTLGGGWWNLDYIELSPSAP